MRIYYVNEQLQDKLKKIAKKDKTLHEQILNKMNEIGDSYDIEHYKNLKYNLKDSKRVHIGSFVLIFQYDKNRNIIYFDDFDHHDEVYRR